MNATRCESCGRFTTGAMIYVGDEAAGDDCGFVGPCCQSPADRGEQ